MNGIVLYNHFVLDVYIYVCVIISNLAQMAYHQRGLPSSHARRGRSVGDG